VIRLLCAAILLWGTPRFASAQNRGATAVGEAIEGLGVNMRVLLIAAHPDDEDTFLITWLSRGRHVETAYLSLTRGDGGQNLIGNELGEALGVIRTEELLAARRIDGAQQFFTRAFDFGFSKDTLDTFRHWARDSILGDVVRVVRAFRPHVIIAMFSGTPRDGHGHHQVSGLLAREVFRVAGDTARFPASGYGAPWLPLKFYGNARYDPTGGETLRFDVGEYSPLLGRSFGEVAGESRSQHKSQGFGTPQRKGPIIDALRREMSRVNESTPASTERSIFDGIDTSWARLRPLAVSGSQRIALDSLPAAFAAVRRAYDARRPAALIAPLARVQGLANQLTAARRNPPTDLDVAAAQLSERVQHALALASGVEVDAFAEREMIATGTSVRAVVTSYNHGIDTVGLLRPRESVMRRIAPGGMLVDTISVRIDSVAQPWWLRTPRMGAMFTTPTSVVSATKLRLAPAVIERFQLPAGSVEVAAPAVFREVDAVQGELHHDIAGAPAIAVALDQRVQYAPANMDFQREIVVHLRSVDVGARDARVSLNLPAGLTADSGSRAVRFDRYGDARDVVFLVRGRLPSGQHRIDASVSSGGESFRTGYTLIDYPHIRRQRLYAEAAMTLSVVDLRIPAALRVAYVTGVSDNVAPVLAQLGVPVTIIAPKDLARADLSPYTTVVIGPRAYEAHPELLAANPHLLEFARKGGTMLVQYGQYEMTQPGVMPYPIALGRPADRVTWEDAAVRMLAPSDKLLRVPNAIRDDDFAGWVQERALYMPRTFDSRYRPLLSMNDPGEAPIDGAILVTPIGQGQYVYTTLALFRQLPAGVPGAARLFLNLLSASIPAANLNP